MMFFKLNYLDKENISYTKTFLEHTLLININEIHEEIDKLSKIELPTLWETFHKISINHLNHYMLNFQEYFPSIQNHSDLDHYSRTLHYTLYSYLLKNIKQHLYLSSTFDNSANQTISFKKAIIDYYTKYEPEKNIHDIDKLNSIISNHRTTFKNFRNDNNILARNPILYNNLACPTKNNPYEIFQVTSNIFIYTLRNWNKCKYNYYKNKKRKKKKDDNNKEVSQYKFDFTSCNFKNLKSFCEKFLEKNVTFMDLYLFERIFNVQHTLYSYFSPKIYIDNLQQEEQTQLYVSLLPIAYLPNMFENYNLIYYFIDIYKNLYRYYNFNEFNEGLKKFCLDFSLYFIPLYNILYVNLVNIYCNIHKCDIKNFLSINLKHCEKITDYKEIYFNIMNKSKFKTFSGHDVLLKPSEINRDKIFNEITFTVTASFDFELLNRMSIIDGGFNFERNLLSKLISHSNIDKYQKNLKQFILNILDNTNIDMLSSKNVQ